MQLTGDRFTSETAVFGNDLATLPDFPAEIRAPAGSLAGRLRLPGALRRPRHPHARRPAERPRRDEPGRAQGQHRRPREGRDGHRQHRRLQRAQPAEGRVRVEPARGRLARRLPPAPGRALVDDGRGAEGHRGSHVARGGAVEELLRARPDVVALPPAGRGDDRVHRGEVREAAGDRRGEHEGVQGGLELRRDVGGLRELVRDRAGEGRARHVSTGLGEHGAHVRPRRCEQALGPPALPRCLPDHAGVGRPRAARAAEALRRAHVPGRGRDRRVGRCARRCVRWRARA